MDANLLSLKQQNHPDLLLLVKALEQENVSLKQELEAQKEQAKVEHCISINSPDVVSV